MIIFIHIYPPENWYKNERIQTFLSVTKLDISVGVYDFMACYQFLECNQNFSDQLPKHYQSQN